MPAPVNDNFANAIALTGTSGTVGPYVIDSATREASEPFPFGGSTYPYKTIWFTFVPTATSSYTFSTQGSPAGDAPSGDGEAVGSFGNLDTQMALYHQTGSGFAGLAQLANNDDTPTDPSGLWSYMTGSGLVAGETYYVQVGVFASTYVGSVNLTYTLSGGGGGGGGGPTGCLILATLGGAGLGGPPIQAGLGNTTFDNDPPDNSLLIATATQFNPGGSVPSAGSLSGFGVPSWERIYSNGQDSTLSEVFVAMQPTYTSGKLTYTFSATWAALTFASVINVPLSGLSTNGVSTIRNITSWPGGSGAGATYTQATPFGNTDDRVYTALWRRSSASAITLDTVPAEAINQNDRNDIPSGQSLSVGYSLLTPGTPVATWAWDPAGSSTWWAMSMELISGCSAPYWGILAGPG